MKKEAFLRFPLSLLHNSKDEVDFFSKAANYSVVNAGIGFETRYGSLFEDKLHEQAECLGLDTESLKPEGYHAIVGSALCEIELGDPTGISANKTHKLVQKSCTGSPVISIKSQFFWMACHTARWKAGLEPAPVKKMDWREFVVLVAIYSLKPNRWNFSIAGWTSISARACGFHNLKTFMAQQSFPSHCQPLTRKKVDSTIRKMERLRFFIRYRICKGMRGGMTAYSIRIKNRSQLALACFQWQENNRGAQIRQNRVTDLELNLKHEKERQERNHLSQNSIRRKISASQSQSASQVVVQPEGQHNEKDSDEKCSDKKDSNQKDTKNNIPSEVGLEDKDAELGYLLEGIFLSRQDAINRALRNPNLLEQFKSAIRYRFTDGRICIEETLLGLGR